MQLSWLLNHFFNRFDFEFSAEVLEKLIGLLFGPLNTQSHPCAVGRGKSLELPVRQAVVLQQLEIRVIIILVTFHKLSHFRLDQLWYRLDGEVFTAGQSD